MVVRQHAVLSGRSIWCDASHHQQQPRIYKAAKYGFAVEHVLGRAHPEEACFRMEFAVSAMGNSNIADEFL